MTARGHFSSVYFKIFATVVQYLSSVFKFLQYFMHIYTDCLLISKAHANIQYSIIFQTFTYRAHVTNFTYCKFLPAIFFLRNCCSILNLDCKPNLFL